MEPYLNISLPLPVAILFSVGFIMIAALLKSLLT